MSFSMPGDRHLDFAPRVASKGAARDGRDARTQRAIQHSGFSVTADPMPKQTV
jgi:hypothetical protein